MIIYVTEEYGYRLWEWDYPGSHDELVTDWREGRAPLDFFDPSKANPKRPYRGTMRQVEEFPEGRQDYEAHVHMPDDTSLTIRGTTYLVAAFERLLADDSIK